MVGINNASHGRDPYVLNNIFPRDLWLHFLCPKISQSRNLLYSKLQVKYFIALVKKYYMYVIKGERIICNMYPTVCDN